MQLAICTALLAVVSQAAALRQLSRGGQPLRIYVYPVSVRDFQIDAEVVDKYERWLDMSVVPVPHGIDGVETDVEQNHVLHNPDVGLAANVEKFGLRVDKPEDANLFWLPISNVVLCLAAWVKHEAPFPNPSKTAWTCRAYVSILKWLFEQESWRRNAGADHVFDIDQIPQGFGGLDDNATHHMLDKALAKSIIITKEDRSADAIQRIRSHREVIVPYFVDRNRYLMQVMPSKTALVSFVGSSEVDCHVENCDTWNSLAVRERIMHELRGCDDAALVDVGANRLPSNFDSSSARDVYAKSTFCVAPAGDSFSSARLFSVLMATCIPVNINDNVQLPFEEVLPLKWEDFSVNIEEKDLLQHGMIDQLRKLAADKALIWKMQDAGRRAAHLLSYASKRASLYDYLDNSQTMIIKQLGHIVGVEWHPEQPIEQRHNL